MKKVLLTSLLTVTIMTTWAQMSNTGNIRFNHGGHVSILGDFTNTGDHHHHPTTDLLFHGTALQRFTTNDTLHVHNLVIANNNGIEIDGILEVDGQLQFISGIISEQTSAHADTKIIMMDGSTVPFVPDNTKYANLPVMKIGDDAFTFPVGDGNLYRPLSITAPSAVDDEFLVEYFRTDPTPAGFPTDQKESTIDNISDKGYYDLQRTNGTSDVTIALYYDANEWYTFNDECNLVIVHWDGSEWENLGNGGTTGDATSGMMSNGIGNTAGNPAGCSTTNLVTSFSPFALGSVDPGLVLPVELLSFNAVQNNQIVDIFWSTATETNSDYFDVEHSLDGIEWTTIDQVQAAGNSSTLLNYKTVDNRPFIGENLYRLKQVDQDGSFEYSGIRSVNFTSEQDIVIYPNPTTGIINIRLNENIQATPTLVDLNGKSVMHKVSIIEQSEKHMVLDINNLKQGNYLIKMNGKLNRVAKINK